MIKVAILTLSDTRKKDDDLSGKVIKDLLSAKIYEVCKYDVICDDKDEITKKLLSYVDELRLDLVLTTGGTGLGPRDVTPEATKSILEKEIPGIIELIRMEGIKKTKRAAFSRAAAGIRKNTLIINLPGSPKGAGESLEAVLDIIPHSFDMIRGEGHKETG